MSRRLGAVVWAALFALLWVPACPAAALRYCDRPAALSAGQQDTLLRFSALIKAELEASGERVAIVARSGLDLSRFGVRYSHAAIGLRAGANDNGTPWSVRQLYFACDEQRPKIFDQGLSGFVLGVDEPALGYVSIVLLPPAEAGVLERVARDNRRALQLLGPAYSANAYPFSVSYQNCNQWVMEMLATAWGPADDAEPARTVAQRWLADSGYTPTVFDAGGLTWLSALIPWVHNEDHPAADIDRGIYRVSMPASIEAFVRAAVPAARRLEFCHAGPRVVIRRGWEPIAEGCVAAERDTVVTLE